MSNLENEPPTAPGARGLMREVRELLARPPAGVLLQPPDNDLRELRATLEGPADTPYEGGQFAVRLTLGRDFPAAAPRASFLTKIFHPNVSPAGDICVDTLNKDWRPELGIRHVLLVSTDYHNNI